MTDPNFLGKLYPATIISQYSDEANSASSISINHVEASNGEAFLWYVAPLDFVQSHNDASYSNKAIRKVNVTIDATLIDGSIVSQPVMIEIVRPPLMMVHGLGGDPSSWDNFRYSDPATNQIYTYVNSNLKDNPIFFMNATAIKLQPNTLFENNANTLLSPNINGYSFSSIIREIRKMGYASNQVDYVCHSMGGSVLRTAIGFDSKYRVYSNYNQGFVHKAITINTPHNGSPLGDFVTEIFPLLGGNIESAILTKYYNSLSSFIQPVMNNKNNYVD